MSDRGGALGLVALRGLLLRLMAAHRGALQRDPMGLVDQAIEDRVGKGGVADAVVPVFERQLTGHEGGAATVAVLQDFEQVAALAIGQRGEAPVIEDHEVGFGQGGEQLAVGAVGAGKAEVVEQARQTEVADGEAVPAGALPKGAGDVGLAGAGRADEQHGLMLADPLARGEAQQERAVESAGAAEVEVLEGRRGEAEPGELQQPGESPVGAGGDFALDEEGEAVLEAEPGEVPLAQLLTEGGGHPGQAEGVKLFDGLLDQHKGSPAVRGA